VTGFRWVAPLIVVLTGWTLAAGRAEAYPEWAPGGAIGGCHQCHLAPAGGGLLSRDGRRAVGEQLSSFSGQGAVLHGAAALPGWLVLGADLRGGYAATDVGDRGGPGQTVALTQADAALALLLDRWSVLGTLGTRGDFPGGAAGMVPAQNYQPVAASRLVSREHWLMWRPRRSGVYVRAGRFFAPFGLQLAQSATFVRRDLGFNQLEESYNLSGGYLGDSWQAHLSAFAPDFVRHFGSEESGGAGTLERRIDSGRGAVAIQAKYGRRTGSSRAVAGVVGKYRVTPLATLFFTEADVVRFSVDGLPIRGQAIGLLGGSVTPTRGVTVTGLLEHFQQDLQVSGAARSAGMLVLDWLPYAHFEAQISARVERAAGGDRARSLLAQLHYFL